MLDWLRRDLRNELTQCSTHKSGRGLRPHYSQPNSWNPAHTPVEACKLEQLLFNFHVSHVSYNSIYSLNELPTRLS